ncbi:queuosine salvage protein-like [Argonauta hians]
MSESVLLPKASSQYIAETSQDVTINSKGVKKVANLMYEAVKEQTFDIKNWKKHKLHPSTMDENSVDWIFVVDTLNFSFWSADDNNKYTVTYKDESYTGYWSLCAAVNRALDNGIPITTPAYCASVSEEQLSDILKSDSSEGIPMFAERLHVLKQTCKIVMKKYSGSFVNCIKECDNSAENLLQIIVTNLPSYRDEATYGSKQVSFYKRAQILIADIWACFEGQGLGSFYDIDYLTIFADYRIPQILAYYEVLQYSDSLLKLLQEGVVMKNGDRYEMEIRGCSIWAVEMIYKEAKVLLDGDKDRKDCLFNSVLIDHFLWDYRRSHADDMNHVPFHKVRCIYY